MIPITIITGFLGSGKTSLINTLIKQNKSKKFGLIINEFGEVGIDGQLIEASSDEVFEISNGCICCIVRKDLLDGVEKVISSQKLDYLIIETSGLADPGPVTQTFAVDNLGGKISLDAVICTVDAVNFSESRKEYEVLGDQISFSDMIVINKADLVDDKALETLKQEIKKINPAAPIFINHNGDLPTEVLLQTDSWNLERLAAQSKEEHHHHHHEHHEVDEVVFVTDKIIKPEKLDAWMQNEFPQNAIRAKGFLRLEAFEGQEVLFVFHKVGAFRSITPFVPSRPDFDFKTSRLVFIGKGLDKEKILKSLKEVVS